MARPRPVPPYWRVVEASTCENDRKSRSTRSPGIPIPVSRTVQCSNHCSGELCPGEHCFGEHSFGKHCSGEHASAVIVTSTPPEGVNLTELLSRLTSTCRNRVIS